MLENKHHRHFIKVKKPDAINIHIGCYTCRNNMRVCMCVLVCHYSETGNRGRWINRWETKLFWRSENAMIACYCHLYAFARLHLVITTLIIEFLAFLPYLVSIHRKIIYNKICHVNYVTNLKWIHLIVTRFDVTNVRFVVFHSLPSHSNYSDLMCCRPVSVSLVIFII